MPVAIKVLLGAADRPNANGRVYPRQLLERVVAQHDTAKSLAFIHDDYGLMLQNVVGQVIHLQLAPDGNLYGTVKLIDTPRGLDLQELWLNDFRPKFGMSGTGTVEGGVIQDDYHFMGLTVDLGPTFNAENRLRNVLKRKMGLPVKYETPSPASDTIVNSNSLRRV